MIEIKALVYTIFGIDKSMGVLKNILNAETENIIQNVCMISVIKDVITSWFSK